jgi:diguanylate cyclase (GGDEF)-like protein/PAS domain S-box-containing protein
MRLSNFISENCETILQEWEEFAATLVPVSQETDSVMLRDHAKQMLETIAADLARPDTAFEKSEKSKGHRAQAVKTAAAIHGADRLASGFSLDAAVAEYRALRATVTRLWRERHFHLLEPETELDDLIRFNEAIDQAISESVTSYSFEKEQQTRVFDTILSSIPDLSYTFDLEGRFAYANKALTALFELPLDKIAGKNHFDLGLPHAVETHREIQQVIDTKRPSRGEVFFTPPSGKLGLYEYIFVPVLNKEGAVEAVAGTARDITERKAAEHVIWKKANFDMVTGLPNRRLFCDRLEQDVKHAKRIGAPLALLFIDLDHFKEANDRFGHDAGDLLLRLAAERILSCVRETDTAARLGGDEFTVILQDLREPEHVEIVAEKIRQQLADPFQIGDHTAHISASIGITLCPQDASTPEQLINNADQAMYAAKNAGRNRFSFFSPNLTRPVGAGRRLIDDLRVALPQHQFTVVYQPILDIADGRIIKAEALLRWNHSEMGLLLPGQFMESAEDAGLMNEIGNWVFTEAALRSREWSALSGMPFQININLSAKQFIDHAHTRSWRDYIKSLGLALHSISVDIKEEVLLNERADARDRIVALHDAGIDVAVDDFGAGSLSIAYLKKFSVDTIKIDQALVQDMMADASSQAIPEAIIAMAHKLGIKVIAEGVETPDQRDWLQAAGCDYAQGYLFSAAVGAKEFAKLLQHA